MGRSSSSIDVFLRLHGQRRFSKELDTGAAHLEAMGVRGAAALGRFAKTSESFKKFGASWTRHVTLPTVVGAGLAVKAAMDWESAFTGVRKTVDASEAQYASMERGIRKMALQVPVAATELAGIAEAAGQLGIERKSILGFTRTIADLGVASNLAGEEGASILAQFANRTNMSQSNFGRLGSTIVALGNAGASTEKDIAAMGLRIASAGTIVGLSQPQILGIANAMSSLGIEAEAGGTAVSTVLKTINSAVLGGGKELESFASIAGQSSDAFAASWRSNPASALVTWISGLGRIQKEGGNISKTLDELSPKLRGVRVQDTLESAVTSGGDLKKSIGLGSKAWRENSALTEEANKRYRTFESRLVKLKNRVIDVGITVGQQLIPPLIQFVNFAAPKIGAAVEAFGNLPGPVKAATLGLLVLTGPVASGIGYMAGGVGRLVVLMSRLGKASQIFQATLSPKVMTESGGWGGAFGAASKEMGLKGGLQTAKGFGASLGLGLAGIGIGDILLQATQGDWKGAGIEAAGALAGGIAGSFAGPMGAMIGVGIGSMGAKVLSGLFDSHTVSRFTAVTDHATEAMEDQKLAVERLAGARRRERGADRAHRRSTHLVAAAHERLNQVVQRFGAASRPARRAELRLAEAQHKDARTAREAKRAHQLHGNALKLFNRETVRAYASEKQRLPILNRTIHRLNAQLKKHPHNLGLLKKVVDREKERGDVTKTMGKYVREAAEKSGPKLTTTLKNMNQQQATYGTHGKVLVQRLKEQKSKAAELAAMGGRGGSSWMYWRQEIEKTTEALQRFNHTGPFTPSPPPSLIPRGGPSGANRPQTHRRSSFPTPAPNTQRRIKGGPILDRVSGDLHITVVSELDGEKVAENTTRHSMRRANRE